MVGQSFKNRRIVEEVENCARYGSGGGVGACMREKYYQFTDVDLGELSKENIPPVINKLASPINSGISKPDPLNP